MQRRVLDYLYNQGGLTIFAFPGEDADYEALEQFALVQNAGARFVLFDLTAKRDGNTGITVNTLFERDLTEDDIKQLEALQGQGWSFGGYSPVNKSEDAFRKFYHNLELLKKKAPHMVALLPGDEPGACHEYIFHIAKAVVIGGSAIEAAAAYVEDSPALQKAALLWLLKGMPNKKVYPRTYKAVKRSFSKSKEFRDLDWKKSPEKFNEALALLSKAEILRKNPLDGLPKIFVKLFFLFFIVIVLLPFVYPTKIDMDVSNMRDRFAERDKLSVAPSFEYTFDGKETVQRIARYAIGRFNAVITNDKMLKRYIQETMAENGYAYKAWEKNNLIYPPEGTVIKFSRPDNLSKAAADSIGAAWKYWTTIVSDSVAYITEFYHEFASENQRQHNGIDLASRQGARILAPFAAKAWTSKDERGGIIIGLVREKDVVIFMHCDQLLYLDGQEVMPGDPIATVGTTGHTTGPHAHIVTGLISKNGNKRIGNVKYKVIDPIKWFYMFKPSSP